MDSVLVVPYDSGEPKDIYSSFSYTKHFPRTRQTKSSSKASNGIDRDSTQDQNETESYIHHYGGDLLKIIVDGLEHTISDKTFEDTSSHVDKPKDNTKVMQRAKIGSTQLTLPTYDHTSLAVSKASPSDMESDVSLADKALPEEKLTYNIEPMERVKNDKNNYTEPALPPHHEDSPSICEACLALVKAVRSGSNYLSPPRDTVPRTSMTTSQEGANTHNMTSRTYRSSPSESQHGTTGSHRSQQRHVPTLVKILEYIIVGDVLLFGVG
ncbi:MAG: hypothetical protein L6R41_001009 [Letrouitia leprolyta]|nr:MAG: hypothetical protein L6R41_001009 [Letrouitia leprolyta]